MVQDLLSQYLPRIISQTVWYPAAWHRVLCAITLRRLFIYVYHYLVTLVLDHLPCWIIGTTLLNCEVHDWMKYTID